jgi:hypothetical protein
MIEIKEQQNMIDVKKVEELREKLDSLTYDYCDFNDNDLAFFDDIVAELGSLQVKETKIKKVIKKHKVVLENKYSSSFPEWAKYEETPYPMECDLYYYAEGVIDSIITELGWEDEE